MKRGIVYLVGAGPGDPRLITLRGAEVLRDADVVIYDRLVGAALLDLAPDRAERIYAGKRPGEVLLDQDAIDEVLVHHALQGKKVVRLKGGDPFVFGRGAEEALACRRAGIDFEIVPGVSSAFSAPAHAGIPLTHRGLAVSFAVVTATRRQDTMEQITRIGSAVDTVVVLMAVGKLAETCAALVASGRPPEEPVALIQSASTPEQRTLASTLSELPESAAAEGIEAPATLVVGKVAALAGELSWFLEDPRRGEARETATS
jgi:uroporphyrin-III C-methyltransferase